MKAIVCTGYGPPEVLQIKEIPKPVPRDNEVLIKVYASTVTSGDVRLRSFTFAPWFWLPGRIMYGFRKPRTSIPGDEMAGEIDSAGQNVTRFKAGDRVVGIPWTLGFGGGNAEYLCMSEDEMVALIPENISFQAAASIPVGGLTALFLLRKAGLQSGSKILIYGASGSVGTYAVQLAKYFGAEVTAVCSTGNIELVKSIGADKVIDYTEEDFTKSGLTYDFIFDTVIKTSFSQCKNLLNESGAYLTVDYPLLQAFWISILKILPGWQPGIKIIFGVAPKNVNDLKFLVELVGTGKITPVIDRCFPLEQIADAHRYVEKGHKKGNLIITIGHTDINSPESV